jgi:hypothetical protein
MIDRINWKCVMVCGVLFCALYTVMAQARDAEGRYADSPHSEWFKSQHNSEGQWCCTDADGHQFYGEYVINVDGSVTAFDGQQKYEIESYKVLTGRNPTGSPVWWFVDTASGRTTYCFSPGSLT